MSTGVLETCRELEKNIYEKKRILRQVGYLQELDRILFHSFSLFMVGKPDGKKTVGRFGHRLVDNIKTGIEKMNMHWLEICSVIGVS
jgi:hypothetical protein